MAMGNPTSCSPALPTLSQESIFQPRLVAAREPQADSDEAVPAERFSGVCEAIPDEKWKRGLPARKSRALQQLGRASNCVCVGRNGAILPAQLLGLFSHLEIISCLLPERLINISNYRHSI